MYRHRKIIPCVYTCVYNHVSLRSAHELPESWTIVARSEDDVDVSKRHDFRDLLPVTAGWWPCLRRPRNAALGRGATMENAESAGERRQNSFRPTAGQEGIKRRLRMEDVSRVRYVGPFRLSLCAAPFRQFALELFSRATVYRNLRRYAIQSLLIRDPIGKLIGRTLPLAGDLGLHIESAFRNDAAGKANSRHVIC